MDQTYRFKPGAPVMTANELGGYRFKRVGMDTVAARRPHMFGTIVSRSIGTENRWLVRHDHGIAIYYEHELELLRK